jgi:hypothetical protein
VVGKGERLKRLDSPMDYVSYRQERNYVSMGMKQFDDSRKATHGSCWQRLYIAKTGMKK